MSIVLLRDACSSSHADQDFLPRRASVPTKPVLRALRAGSGIGRSGRRSARGYWRPISTKLGFSGHRSRGPLIFGAIRYGRISR
jgi:hypothetical protein